MCIYVIYIDSILPLVLGFLFVCLFVFVHSIKIDWLKHEKNVSPQTQLRIFVSVFLCIISEQCKNQSLFLKKKQYSLESKEN